MIKNIGITLIFLFVFCSAEALSEKAYTLRAGTPVSVIFTKEISDKNIQPGQSVEITVSDDVKIGNKVFFKKGDIGTVFVDKVFHARKFGKAGRIEFGGTKIGQQKINGALIAPFTLNVSGKSVMDGYIIDSYGNQQAISFKSQYKGKRNTFINVISSSMIWNPIGWATFWIKGTDAVIPQNQLDTAILLNDFILE